MHSCDNSICVRIDVAHVHPGTNDENMADMVAKKRSARHERHHCAKLNTGSVRLAKALEAMGVTQRTIARVFGVSQQTISAALRGQTWKDVA